jgi:hypothetical protein
MGKDRDAIKAVARQLLQDDIPSSGENPDIKPDVLDMHVDQALVEVSGVCPYIYRETVVSDGTRDISLSSITNLIGDKVEKVEYPTGSSPPDYIHDFTIFGTTLRLNADTPTSGQNIYLYCHKVHTLTKATSTLTADLERVLIQGIVAYAALTWLNQMRSQIVPSSNRWYHDWANNHYVIYQNGLRRIAPTKAWEF